MAEFNGLRNALIAWKLVILEILIRHDLFEIEAAWNFTTQINNTHTSVKRLQQAWLFVT